MSGGGTTPAGARRLDRLRTLVLRLGAAFLFVLTLDQWIRLVGIIGGPLGRFDLMPVAWRVASATLAVLYPVAGIGLWMLAPWGPVIWFLVASTLAVMQLGFPAIFGGNWLVVAPHAAGLFALALLGLLRRRAERHASLRQKGRASK